MSEVARSESLRTWALGVVEAGARSRGRTPDAVLLAIFDVLDEWFNRADSEAEAFIGTLLEISEGSLPDDTEVESKSGIRVLMDSLAGEALLEKADEFASSLHILIRGSVVSAAEGEPRAARYAREMARDLIARHSQTDRDRSSDRSDELVDVDNLDWNSIEWIDEYDHQSGDGGGRRSISSALRRDDHQVVELTVADFDFDGFHFGIDSSDVLDEAV